MLVIEELQRKVSLRVDIAIRQYYIHLYNKQQL